MTIWPMTRWHFSRTRRLDNVKIVYDGVGTGDGVDDDFAG